MWYLIIAMSSMLSFAAGMVMAMRGAGSIRRIAAEAAESVDTATNVASGRIERVVSTAEAHIDAAAKGVAAMLKDQGK